MRLLIKYVIIVLFVLIPGFTLATESYSLSKIGYPQGLSNSAVLSVFRDNEGFMWFGTYDGLNRYDGKKMDVYRADPNRENRLLNNVIYKVSPAEQGNLWISTSTGINLLSLRKEAVMDSYEIFNDEYALYSNRKGTTWMINDGNLFYYDYTKDKFNLISHLEHFFNRKLPFVDDKDNLWLFSSENNKVYRCHLDTIQVKEPTANMTPVVFHQKRIEYTSYQNGILGFIDEDKDLFLADLSRNTKIYIRNVADLMARYGIINGIVSFHEDIILSFVQNGLIKLDASDHYSETVIDQSIRIFSIYKDPEQDIIWVATDGHGVMAYSRKNSLASHLMFSQLQHKIVRQVRSIYTDKQGDLWFGTKGDGLVRVEKYEQSKMDDEQLLRATSVYFPNSKRRISDYNRGTSEYQVFGIIPSRFRDILWIGSADAPALSYYDYQKDKVVALEGDIMHIERIHQVYEQNDSTLWITSSGMGFQQIILEEEGTSLKVKRSRRINIVKGKTKVNDFFPMVAEGDSVLWLGSRGMGLVRYSLERNDYDVFHIGYEEFPTINDILCIHKKGDDFYLGTVSGLVRARFDEKGMGNFTCVARYKGMLNDMVHGILEDENGFLWLSTNKGLVKYNTNNSTFHTYYYSNGLQIGEFSDDAFYQSEYTGKLYFGGIDGLLNLEQEAIKEVEYHTGIRFYNLSLGLKSVPFYDYYNEARNTLVFKGIQTSLSLSFGALDYIEGDNFEYSYKLEGGKQTDWSAFSSNNTVKFNSLSYGHYTLMVRYKKDVSDVEYKTYSLHIHVLRPWYLTPWAFVAYFIGFLVLAVYGFYLARKYYRREKLVKELMKYEMEKSDMHNACARFRDLATSFSTIYRQCGEMQRLPNLPSEVRQLLDTTHETILSFAFRAEGGPDIKTFIDDYIPQNLPVYEEVSVKDLSDELIRMFIYKGQEDLSSLTVVVSDDLKVSLPKHALGYILYYLYSRSLETEEQMQVEAEVESSSLVLHVSVSESLIPEVVEEKKMEGEALKGDFSDYLYRWLYTYALRALRAQIEQKDTEMVLRIPMLPLNSVGQISTEKAKKTVLLLEDKNELAWMVADMLGGEYEVHCVSTTQEAFSYLRKNSPDVFLADTLIYLNKEDKFLEYIESNKGLLMRTIFVPMLTWNSAFLLHRELLRLVDGFVVMPYNLLFIREIVTLSLNRREKNPEVLVELPGQKEFVCETVEQANFVKRLMQILDANLDKENLNTAFIAEQMNISLRQYYRKFKEVSTLSSTDFIKKYRIERAARLLVETDSSVQEIIGTVGIQSRSYFYKEFAARFGCTPKVYKKTMQDANPSEAPDSAAH